MGICYINVYFSRLYYKNIYQEEKNLKHSRRFDKFSHFFFYTSIGDRNESLLDLVFFINFFFDFLILLATKLVLKENISFWRLIIGSLVASLSIFLLFLSLSSLELFLIKVVASVFIILVTFGKKNFFQDLLYFYLISIILGGFLYLFDISFTYENQGIVFFGHGLGLNLIAMCILSPIFLYFYIKENKRYKKANIHYSFS